MFIFKNPSRGVPTTVIIKLVVCFVAGALSALLLYSLLGI
jgi:hypothetical protein